MDLKELLNQESATLVDVREPFEYEAGHVEGSINIPLGNVATEVDRFKVMSKPLILFCRSGGRSGMATALLKSKGLEDVHNGGGWEAVRDAKDEL
ncbi:MAG: rhodanese-like domain-containing protein [Bacteroidota bacterium]